MNRNGVDKEVPTTSGGDRLMRRFSAPVRWWTSWPHHSRAAQGLLAVMILLPFYTPVRSLWFIWEYGARGRATDGVMSADFTTMTFLLLLGVYALLVRTVRAFPVAAMWVLAWMSADSLFAVYVHQVFVKLSLYPGFLVGPGQTEANRNFAKLLCLFVVGVLLLVNLLRRRTRSFDRIFVTLMFWSVFTTFWLFHAVTLIGIKEARVQGTVALRLIAQAPAHFVRPICEAGGARCFTGKVGEAVAPTGNAVLDAYLERHLKWFAQRPTGVPSDVVDFSNDRRGVFSLVGHLTEDGHYRFAVDTVRYRGVIYLYQGVYSALANAAHLLWLGGGFYLMAWHRRRLRARLKSPRTQS